MLPRNGEYMEDSSGGSMLFDHGLGMEDVEHFWSVRLTIPGVIADMTNGEYSSVSSGGEGTL